MVKDESLDTSKQQGDTKDEHLKTAENQSATREICQENRENQSNAKDEYLDASDNMRQFGNVCFSQITLFIAITAGIIIAGLFQSDLVLSDIARITLKIGGVIVTFIFWALDQREMIYWNHYRQRAIELEKSLGFQQYTEAPATSVFSATNAIRMLYLSILVFWIMTLLWHSQF